jgi:acetyltransferase-like isoleucine patch superfamily enzyme
MGRTGECPVRRPQPRLSFPALDARTQLDLSAGPTSAAKAVVAAVLAWPYRFRLQHVGRRPRIFPPLLISGGRRIAIGDDARIESYVALSAGAGGRITIGARCELRPFAQLEADTGFIEIGDGCSVNQFCVLNGFGGITIGQGVRMAAHTVVLSSSHQFDDSAAAIHAQGVTARRTIIGDDVWIGAHVVVLGGVHIGAHSVIGAGAVVRDDIPEFAVAAGIPARVVRDRRRGDVASS